MVSIFFFTWNLITHGRKCRNDFCSVFTRASSISDWLRKVLRCFMAMVSISKLNWFIDSHTALSYQFSRASDCSSWGRASEVSPDWIIVVIWRWVLLIEVKCHFDWSIRFIIINACTFSLICFELYKKRELFSEVREFSRTIRKWNILSINKACIMFMNHSFPS